MGVLEGRAAVVSGAAKGIGAAIARRFSEEGATVVLLDLDEAGISRLADELGNGALAFGCDVGDEASVEAAVAGAIDRSGEISILVNNAAAANRRAKITELTLEHWQEALRVNLTGAFLLCRQIIPSMCRREGGAIINVASQLGSVAVPNSAAYCTSKGALLQFTRALAVDHAQDNIRVNSLSPGAVSTPRLEALYGNLADAEAALAPKHPIGRLGRVEEIAAAALYLASDEASFTTGTDLVVDGGYLAQ